jgi:hypothetical protein
MDIAGLDHDAEGCAVWDHYDPDSPRHILEGVRTNTTTMYTRHDEGDKFSFSIPTSSERYHFVSWGPIDRSQFQVIAVESDKEQIVVEVEIIKDPKGVARVCALPSTGDAETYGVGFYVSLGLAIVLSDRVLLTPSRPVASSSSS